ncbi:MAG TPA: hypothetical protein VEC94_10955 [Pseudolabrys sp.]|jgi:hypothetical protein|nr:hypothetical protein [Pseudolabrys sp.]
MTMNIKISYAVAALMALLLASPVQAQHNRILQSSISGQYDRLIHKDDRSAAVTDQVTENRKRQPKPDKNAGSLAGTATKKSN